MTHSTSIWFIHESLTFLPDEAAAVSRNSAVGTKSGDRTKEVVALNSDHLRVCTSWGVSAKKLLTRSSDLFTVYTLSIPESVLHTPTPKTHCITLIWDLV